MADETAYGVQRGDVWALGRHRLMCGDSARQENVASLFAKRKADIVVTSPPYANCRDYTAKIECWDTLMRQSFACVPCTPDTQLLVNLGVMHRKNEWVPYWWEWLQGMREDGWRHYSLYVWDKLLAVPGCFGGRLKPAHEFVFHLNKATVPARSWQQTKHHGHQQKLMRDVRDRDSYSRPQARKAPVSATKVPDSVIRQFPVRLGETTGHPAQFPVALPVFILKTWGGTAKRVYDPFSGSAATLVAAEQGGEIGYGMEIAPEYCEMALRRWAKAYPDQPPRRC